MSGPKVVRIVTREEIVAICEGHLARVEAALEEWKRIGRRNDCLSAEEMTGGEARLAKLRALLAREDFDRLQKQAPQEIGFLHQDLQQRLAKVAAAAAVQRASARRQAEAAGALLSALRNEGQSIPADMERSLEEARQGKADPKAMAAGFALLSKRPDEGAETRRVLAELHGEGMARISLADWISQQPDAPGEPRLEALDRQLAELVLLNGGAAAFEIRMRAVQAEQDSKRRNLLLDSLSLDLGKALAEARTKAAAASELDLALAEIETLAPGKRAELEARRKSASSKADLEATLSVARAALVAVHAARAAEARRAAVLSSLSSLGYEVREGMATAWVEEGRLVLRNAIRPDYGMEIAGDAAASRIQMRAVAFVEGSAGADRSRDSDAEGLWCSDLARLKTQLGEAGGDLVIERALPIGATPLKRVSDPLADDRLKAREGPNLQSRTLS